MRNKLIAAGVGLVGYGAFLGWAITADKYEAKMRSNQRLLGDIITKQAAELSGAKELILQTIDPKSLPEVDDLEEFISGVSPEARNSWLENHREEAGVASPPAEAPLSKRVDLNEPKESWENETPEETRSNLQSLINTYNANEEDREAFEYMVKTQAANSGPDNTPPFIISHKAYSWDEEGEEHSKIALTYYPNERVLLDEDKDPIEGRDIDGLVGWKNLQRFGDESNDPNTVFVRNRRLLSDFEIYREIENPLPTHVRYGLSRDEFEHHQAVGITRFRRDDV